MYKIKEISKSLLSVDIRALALFRICVGILVIVDLVSRVGDFEAFYSDSGVLPRTVYLSFFKNWHFSLCLLNGSLLWQYILLACVFIAATMLILGYKTRLATVVTWLLVLSFNVRNPLVLNGGDILFLMLLFWSMFLPLGACFSIDSALNTGKTPPRKLLSGGTCGILLQGFFLYFFTGLLKISPEWMQEGSAIYYALSMDQYVKPLGKYFFNFPNLLKVLTFGIVYFEIIGAVLLFSPIFTSLFRVIVAIGILCLHIGFGAILDVGYFPFAGTFIMIPFLPGFIFDKFATSLKTKERLGLKIYYDGDCGFCKKLVCIIKEFFLIPEVSVNTTQSDKSISKDMERYNSWVVVDYKGKRYFKFDALIYVVSMSPFVYPFSFLLKLRPVSLVGKLLYEKVANNRKAASFFTKPLVFQELTYKPLRLTNLTAVFFIVYILLLNIESLSFTSFQLPKQSQWIGYILSVKQKWNMFGADYLKFDGWHVIQGVTVSGKQVDLLNEDQRLTFDKPENVLNIYKNKRWKAYMRNVFFGGYKPLVDGYLNYLCNSWNWKHSNAKRLKYFYIYFMNEQSDFKTQISKVKKQELDSYTCNTKPKK